MVLIFAILAAGYTLGEHHVRSVDILDPAVRERIRHDWELEESAHERQAAAERERWFREQQEHERQKAEERRRWLEARVYWADILPERRCTANGVRVYSGRLANLPYSWSWGTSLDALAACKATSLVFQGVVYASPHHCESLVGA